MHVTTHTVLHLLCGQRRFIFDVDCNANGLVQGLEWCSPYRVDPPLFGLSWPEIGALEPEGRKRGDFRAQLIHREKKKGSKLTRDR